MLFKPLARLLYFHRATPSLQTSTIHLGIYHSYHPVEPVKCRWQVCELQVQLSCQHSKPTKGAWSPSLPLAGRRWTPVRSRYMGTEQGTTGTIQSSRVPAYSTPCARLGPCHYHKTSKHQGKCPPARPIQPTTYLILPTIVHAWAVALKLGSAGWMAGWTCWTARTP